MPFASQAPEPASSSHLGSILDVALRDYQKNTGKDLLYRELGDALPLFDRIDIILAQLQNHVDTLEELRDGNRGFKLMKWISSSVHILYPISAILSDGAGLAFPPAKPIFKGILVLLAAAKDVSASHDTLLDLFWRMDNFFKRFKVYSQSFVNTELADVLVKVVVKVLNILSIATKEVEQSRAKKYIKRLAGRKDIENALGELENLLQGEHYTVTAQVLRDTSGLRRDVEAVGIAVQRIANKSEQQARMRIREDTQKWFSPPPDPSINHNIAWKAYHTGTATWLFSRIEFMDWMSRGSLLWVHGKPGSGKSILCSAIIEHIVALCETGQASVVYFYFDFRDKEKQNSRKLVTSLLIQLSAFSDACCDVIHGVHTAYGNSSRQPTNDVLTNCLKEMLTVVAEQPIYIVVDALDECPDNSGLPTAREEVLDVLKGLVDLHLPNLHVCVTSRPEVDIKSILNQLAIHTVSLHDEHEQQKGIADYVSTIVNSDRKMREWPDEDKELVIKVLSERADGMFRWVVCQLETLRRSAQRNLRGILEKLPKTLDETYERVLEEVDEDNREHARRLLHCIAVAIRPLRVEELAEILAFDFDDAEGSIPKLHANWRWKDQEEAVLFTCSSLIAVVDYHDSDGVSRVVQFSHFSVKGFLISDRLASSTGDLSRYHIIPKPAHIILAQACLGSLLDLDEHGNEQNVKVSFFGFFDLEKTVKDSPLARYAAEHWVAHAQFEDVASRMKDGMLCLFDPDKPHLATWLNIYNIDPRSLLGSPPTDIPNPLYYAALCDFRGLVEHLVTNYPQLVNAIGGCFESPLLAALSKKHIWIAEFLLQHGGKVDVRGTSGDTPLNNAVAMFQEHAVPFLLKHGADANSQNNQLYTPLHDAASYAYLEVSQMLLDRGADVNSRNDTGRTPLHLLFEDAPHIGAKSQVRLPHVARLFLEHGANVNAQDDEHAMPLLQVLEAESNLHLDDIARMLLEHGAEPNVKNKDGKTPLQIVLGRKYYSKDDDAENLVTARLLVEHGADVNAQDKDHTSPLLLAMQRNMYEMARVLLSRGADPDVKNDNGKTALHLLLEGDFSYEDDIPGLVRLLLDCGMDVDAQDEDHATPLLLALDRYMDDIAQICLERGAEPNVKNDKGKTPLHLLLERKCHESDNVNEVLVVERLLLECGADVNAQDEDGITPLHLASNHERLEIAQILLERSYTETIGIEQHCA